MAEVERTCANCGNVQTSGDFCEKCGTRIPAAVAVPVGGPLAAAYQPAPQPTPAQAPPPPPGGQQGYAPPSPGYGAQPSYGAQPGYGAPPTAPYGYPAGEPYRRDSGGWGKFFDLSFEGASSSMLKTLYVVTVGLLALFLLFNIVYGAYMAAKGASTLGVLWIFIWLFMSIFLFFVTRVVFEIMAALRKDK